MRNQPIDLGTSLIKLEGPRTFSTPIVTKKKPLRGITIFSPAALTGTCRVQVSSNFLRFTADPSTITWQDLQSGGANIAVGVDEAVSIDFVGWEAMRVASDTAETSERAFVFVGIEEIP
ncbi:MAG: hypothetical protein V3T23_13815 [Nitrososphaerales archaeon]